MNKITLAIMGLAALVVASQAQTTFTNHGITSTVQLATDTIEDTKVTSVRQDRSEYPDQDSPVGFVWRDYDYLLDGIPTSGQVSRLMLSNTMGTVGYTVPSGTVIRGYTLQVFENSSTATQRFSLGINAVADLVALTTNFNNTALIRSAVIDPAVRATNDNYVLLSTDGGAATSLQFRVIFDAVAP